MASCAVCMRSIAAGEQFVLEDTEVMHRSCAPQSYRSRLRLHEQRMRELEQQVADTRRAITRIETEAARQSKELNIKRAQVVGLQVRERVARIEIEDARQRLQASQDETAAARREVASLREELAALRPGSSDAVADDASAIRFALLELDGDP